jgi:predicted branched-subunit amino acid permease
MSGPVLHFNSSLAAFAGGLRAGSRSVLAYVLFGTYIGVGALAHDFGFSLWWTGLSTLLIWAAPAQVILISTLGAGASLIEVALAVGLSGVRLMPMVVALLPILKGPRTPFRALIFPAHMTAVSMWVESMRLVPQVEGERRIAFVNGLSLTFFGFALTATFGGYYLATQLPFLLNAALLFLTPISFLVSITRNSRELLDRLALLSGLVVGPVLAYSAVSLDIMWSGLIGGTFAYIVHRLRRSRA